MTNNHYKKNKEKLQKEALERYQNLSDGEREKRRKNGREKYQNLSKAEKEKRHKENLSEGKKKEVVEYRRNFYLTQKSN